VVGGGGGYSTHYSQPSYQSGTPGLSGSATWRATPDISLFAANGVLGHYLILCDSSAASTACTSTSTFGGAGGTSFVAPQLTGIAALLAGYTGSRQGPWNTTLYALAKAQFTGGATSSACYSNGQTSNTGVTAGLPASGCLFNDVTTGNNDVPCAAGATGCFVDSGAEYGLLSTTGAASLTVAFPAGAGYDLATGLGSINVYNLIANWSTALAGEAQTISFGALSNRAFGTAPFTVSATASSSLPIRFASETTPVCTVSGSTVTLAAVGTCTIQATQAGNGTYAAATPVNQSFQVTQASQTIGFGALPNQTFGAAPFTVGASASSGLTVSFASDTPAVCTVSGATVTLVAVGTCTIQATQAGNANYAAATPVDQSFAVMANPLQLIPVAPCRIMDTRKADGPLGGPTIPAGATRAIPVPSSSCGIPSNAAAYSLNVTVVPRAGVLNYLTVWPTGQSQPLVSTLNSLDGEILANAAIVPAGTGGSIEAFATDETDLVIDIDGYFVPPTTGSLQFYPLTPCRILDTRKATGTFGGPSLVGGDIRSFPIQSSVCNVPGAAAAYAFNVTVVPPPDGVLAYLTIWPTGGPQPVVSTLNSLNGIILANAAIVPAGSGGAVSFYATNTTDLVLDINGYFAAPAAGGLNFYAATPCRIVDTRKTPDGTFAGPIMGASETRTFPLSQGPCGISDSAAAYSLNMTVQPSGYLGYLTAWPAGEAQPQVSTLNALEGQIVANAALVPAGTGGAVNVFVTNATHVLIDANGYFQ
jgi:hypothetical protein